MFNKEKYGGGSCACASLFFRKEFAIRNLENASNSGKSRKSRKSVLETKTPAARNVLFTAARCPQNGHDTLRHSRAGHGDPHAQAAISQESDILAPAWGSPCPGCNFPGADILTPAWGSPCPGCSFPGIRHSRAGAIRNLENAWNSGKSGKSRKSVLETKIPAARSVFF